MLINVTLGKSHPLSLCVCMFVAKYIYIYIYILLEQNRELVIVLNFEAFPKKFCCSPHMLV